MVERVSDYKYLGVVMDDKLNWSEHIAYLETRLKPRLYCLRKLNSFKVSHEILATFYNSIICSVWTYCLLCWAGNTGKTRMKVIDDIITRVGRVIGKDLPLVNTVYHNHARCKLHSLWKDTTHPLHIQLSNRLISRSGRLRPVVAYTNRYPSSFIGTAIHIHNREFTR